MARKNLRVIAGEDLVVKIQTKILFFFWITICWIPTYSPEECEAELKRQSELWLNSGNE